MPLTPGAHFGRYEIAELLGQGGMGEVYRAQDTLLHRRVALKILHPQAPATAGAESGSNASRTDGAARILREARAAAGIEHPNAISIYDVGEVDGVPFLAMEFVAGAPLRRFVGDDTIAVERRIRWLVDTAKALGAAHALGLVHRDIKPENVMVRSDGVVKVLDFGIARRSVATLDPNAPTEAPAIGTLTAEGVVVGTPFYMAPEQMRGERLDGRADQFSWGVVAYELLTGSRPWGKNLDGLQLVAAILSGEVEGPRAKNPSIPSSVDAVVRKALAKSPSERFDRMDEITDALEAYAGTVSARTPARVSLAAPEEISLAPTEMLRSGAPFPPASPTDPGRASVPSSEPRTEAAKKRGPWRLGLVGAIGLTAAAGIAIGAQSWSSRHHTVASHPTALAGDAAAPGNDESEMSANGDATAAYHAGLQAFRDGSLELASSQLNRALDLDPGFAAAHLRRALLPNESPAPTFRSDLQNARSARQTLSAHDRVLLDALEPWSRVPWDLKESARRLEAALASEPASADFAFQLGWTEYDAYESRKADSAFDAALRADPTFALAWRMKARAHVLLDDAVGAKAAYARCLDVSPSATSCLLDLATLEGSDGDCASMAATLRRVLALSPDSGESYEMLAGALFGSGEPLDAVRAALAQAWGVTPASVRSLVRRRDEGMLAALTGHFAEAKLADEELEKAIATSSDALTHWVFAFDRMLLSAEIGRPRETVSLARDYLRQRSAWQAEDIQADAIITVYALEKRARGMTAAAFETARGEWLAAEQKRIERVGLVASAYAGVGWAWAYALPVENAAEARAALAVRPTTVPLIDGWTQNPAFDEPMGRAYLLGGDADDAIASLSRASRSCAVMSPLAAELTTWASGELGQALETRGRTSEACDAYGRVLKRWGHATPPSRTADAAAARARVLNCPLRE